MENTEQLTTLNEKFSFSKLDTFDNCGFKFKLKYRDKHSYFCESIATNLGTCVHSIEEDIANAIKDGIAPDYKMLKNRLVLKMYELQHKFPDAFEELDKSQRTYKEKIYAYLDSGIYRLENYLKANPSYEVVGTEQYFSVEVEGNRFTGYIDRIIKDTATGEYLVHDVKTYAVPVDKQKLATPLQFVIYVLAMKQLYNIEESQIKCAYDLPFCDIIQDAGTSGFMTRGMKKIYKLLNAISNQEFKPNPTPLCAWCEFSPTNPNQPDQCKNLCPYFSKWTRSRPTFEVEETWQGLEQHNIILENWLKKQQPTV